MAGHAKFVICEQSIERSFAWLGLSRRLSKDYERLPETAETMIYGVMSRLMLRRLAHAA
jgi:transposase